MRFLSLKNLASGETVQFRTAEVRMGRDPGFELPVTGEGSDVVSGSHARVVDRAGTWWLEDAGSRNGTYFNGRKLQPEATEQLAVGTVIGLGARGPRFRVEAVTKGGPPGTAVEEAVGAGPADATQPMDSADDLPPPREAAAYSQPPAPEQVLRIVMMETKSGEQFQASGGRIRIGRGKECELRPVGPDDTAVSRVHSEIVLKPDGRAVVRDAQSRNGTYLNGKLATGERDIGRGDKLRLGASGPELMVARLSLPGEEDSEPAGPQRQRRRESIAAKVVAKLGEARRSFGGKGATVFFNEMFAESSRRTAKKVRWAVWSFVFLLAVVVAAGYYYSEWRVQQATTQIQQEQRAALELQQAYADSIQLEATAEYERLRTELADARAGSAPAAVVESLRVALGEAQERTTALEASLHRAEASLAEQLAAGEEANQAAQAELSRLRSELGRASATGTSGALLDSLRDAVSTAQDRATQIASQMRAMEGVNLAAVAQANQSAVGLVAVYVGGDIYDGSGFALTRSGYFVTNRHVVTHQGQRPDSIYVTMADQRVMKPADLISVASRSGADLAVIKIRGFDSPYVQQADWSGGNAKQGEPAALIGFPAGLGNALDATGTVRTSMSAGIFSKVTSEVVNFDGFTVGGSSGSPIFNAAGEVVAVHRAGLSEAVGMGFAVPIPKLIPLLPAEAKAELGL
jgi:pSer/pThr/pTyr-binding forkhead associated (FHA) protein/S1-C subfamily serine protease